MGGASRRRPDRRAAAVPEGDTGRRSKGPVIPPAGEVGRWTDVYFARTKAIVGRFGDKPVTYAVFMRRPVVSAPRLLIDWLNAIAAERGVAFDIELNYPEGKWVGAGEPILYLSGSLYHLVDLETLFLQKLGAPCVAAYNAFTMCVDLPKVAFLAWHAWRGKYSLAEIRKWLRVFLTRFFATSQFKRSAMPNAPKVGSGGSLSPRGDWRAPSDGTAEAWLTSLDAVPLRE